MHLLLRWSRLITIPTPAPLVLGLPSTPVHLWDKPWTCSLIPGLPAVLPSLMLATLLPHHTPAPERSSLLPGTVQATCPQSWVSTPPSDQPMATLCSLFILGPQMWAKGGVRLPFSHTPAPPLTAVLPDPTTLPSEELPEVLRGQPTLCRH